MEIFKKAICDISLKKLTILKEIFDITFMMFSKINFLLSMCLRAKLNLTKFNQVG